MKCVAFLISGFSFFIVNNGMAQDLSSHRWEQRLVLVKTDDLKNETFRDQIVALKQNPQGLKERKIIVYQIHNHMYNKGLGDEKGWKEIDLKNNKKYLKNSDSGFEIILIGLDGGVKLKQQDFLEIQGLFSKIDVMPMRISEMKNSRRKKFNG